ncbi:MAG TPA: SDR family NAD(P)-dependent oxidoreductase [Candidatus Eremiobacteraceae bacterium]
MDLAGHTVLVTGGTSGIGQALADRFFHGGSRVIVCGRRENRLNEFIAEHPGAHTRACDVAVASERVALAEWAIREHPKLDVVVNNAGIQRHIDFTQIEPWDSTHQEIITNFEAQVHLCMLLIPHLRTQRKPAIINITSGLAFVPLASAPVYSATKAAFHSFTLSLRHQLAKTPIEVIEIAPPAVNTDLGGPGLHTHGVPLDEFVDAAVAQLKEGKTEISYGFSEQVSGASRSEREQIFARMNQA